MSWFGTFSQTLRSHPIRTRLVLYLLAAISLVFVFRHYLWIHVPIWVAKISHPIFQTAQAHPAFHHAVHILINAVPDTAFALLALVGLGYLAPELIKKLEDKLGVRLFLAIFFSCFGVSAIVINAVNRESQEYKDDQNNDRISTVLKSVTNIQDALKPKSVNMTEAERRQHLEAALRDEYILQQNPIDPEILAGNKMPPQDWMNRRLKELGENWAVKNEPKQNPTQVIQLPPEEKRVKLEFGFYQDDLAQTPLQTVQIGSLVDGKATFSISGIVRGDASAKNLHIWIRRCNSPCEWVPPNPPGFSESSPEQPYDLAAHMLDMPPNVGMGKWTFVVKVPKIPGPEDVAIRAYYSCTNCAPVDWNKPQTLWVSPNFSSFKRHVPSISYTPEPVPK